ncbi:Putative uncharacterized transposon-derived protein, partial [Frankliniella fusca]
MEADWTFSCGHSFLEPLSDPADVQARWRDWFRDLLNAGDQEFPAPEQPAEGRASPSVDEILDIIGQLKKKSAPGVDGIPAPLLQHGGRAIAFALKSLIDANYCVHRPSLYNYLAGAGVPQKLVDIIRPALLAYTDDLAVVAATRQALVDVSARIRDNALRFGLRISPKTNFMVVSRRTDDPAHGDALQVGIDSFERVETFKYLGVLIDRKNSLDPEIRARCQAGLRTFHSLAPHLRSKRVLVRARVRLFETIKRPAILYGAEAWTFKQGPGGAHRRAVGPIYDEEVDRYVWWSNAECRRLTGAVPIIKKAKKRRL